jgi:hypothetical protein
MVAFLTNLVQAARNECDLLVAVKVDFPKPYILPDEDNTAADDVYGAEVARNSYTNNQNEKH